MKDDKTIVAGLIMDTDLKTIESEKYIQNAIDIMRNKNTEYLIVMNEKEFKGIFRYKQLLYTMNKNLSKTKINKITLLKPPIIPKDTSFENIAYEMYRHNIKNIPVGDTTIEGIISEKDMLSIAIQKGFLKNKKVIDFITAEPICLNDSDTIGKAESIMRENDISRLPVIDSDDKLIGLVESKDIITKKIEQNLEQGVIKSKSENNSMTATTYTPNEVANSEINIKSIMNTQIVTTDIYDDVENCFKNAKNLNITTIIAVDSENIPLGLIAPKDIIQYIASFVETEQILYQISGINKLDLDEFEIEKIHNIIKDTIMKISKQCEVNSFTIHIKEYKKQGENTKYTLRCKTDTYLGLFRTKTFGWDVLDITSNLLKNLEKNILTKKGYMRDTAHKKKRDNKHINNN
ncbi:MAG: CBS domain-containing protein [DPANN group archaeon]|nr:CBS domain-containing protein [DPANN group archaeon]